MSQGKTYKFELTFFDQDSYANLTTEIEEPKGFGEFTSILKRDFETGGVFFQFSESNLSLQFPGVGRGILENQWQAFGVNAAVTITVSSAEQDKLFETIYTGEAVMKNRLLTPEYFAVDFEEVSLINKINSRKDIPISLDDTEDLDGGSIDSITANTVSFPTVSTLSESIVIITQVNPQDINIYNYTGSNPPSYSNTFAVNKDEVMFTKQSGRILNNNTVDASSNQNDLNGRTILLESQQTSGNNLTQTGGYLSVPKSDQDYTVTVIMQMTITTATSTGGPTGTVVIKFIREDTFLVLTATLATFTWDPVGDGDLTNFIVGDNLDSGSFVSGPTTIDSGTSQPVGQERYKYYYTITSTISGGTTVNIQVGNSTGEQPTIQITTLGVVPAATDIDLFYIYDALQKNIQVMAGIDVGVESSFFGGIRTGLVTDGCAAYMSETNGYKIRGSAPSVIADFKTRMDSIKAMFNVGWGLERNSYTEDLNTIRVEEYDHFFQDVELIAFTDIEEDSYSEEYYEPLNFTSVKIGYKKFANDENFLGTIEDYCTDVNYTLPVQNLSPQEDSSGNTKRYLSDYIASQWLWEIQRRLGVAETPTISSKYDDNLFIIDLSGSNTIRQSTEFHLSGLTDPTSAYNFRLNAKFNFFNHHNVVNSVLYRNTLNEVIRNTRYRINSDAIIVYKDTQSPCLGDTRTFATLPDGENLNYRVLLSEYRSFSKLFNPILIKFRVEMSSAQVDDVVEGHRNGLTTGKNYGFVSVTRPDGTVKQGWLLQMRFNTVEEIADFELIEKL